FEVETASQSPMLACQSRRELCFFFSSTMVGSFNRVILNIQKRHGKESEKKGKDNEKIIVRKLVIFSHVIFFSFYHPD
ncbi:hypothetical protein, partial [Brevibacillus fortis]|uniref:hypothetical protein n=1 Tax=Brevibacillus fortis TaxID=2126352 RepID=UPI003D1EDD10